MFKTFIVIIIKLKKYILNYGISKFINSSNSFIFVGFIGFNYQYTVLRKSNRDHSHNLLQSIVECKLSQEYELFVYMSAIVRPRVGNGPLRRCRVLPWPQLVK